MRFLNKFALVCLEILLETFAEKLGVVDEVDEAHGCMWRPQMEEMHVI